MKRPTYGSLFAGIEGFGLGASRAGFHGEWAVEIDPQARRVIRHHWPDKAIHDDVREVGKHNLTPVDVIFAGFPCQDLSVAGKRAGITGDRSGLFYEMTRIADELRPRFLVWENVPGLLNSFTAVNPPPEDAPEGSEWEMDEDSDFEAVLCELQRIGFHGCWSSLDARWFGVAQRRCRVFGVFTGVDSGAEGCAEILALQGRLRGDFEAGGETGAGVASAITGSAGRRCGQPGKWGEVTNNLVASDDDDGLVIAPTLDCSFAKKQGLDNQHIDNGAGLFVATPIDMRQASRGGTMTNNRPEGSSGGAPGTGIGDEGDPAPTIAASHTPAVCVTGEQTHALTSEGHDASEDGTGRGNPIVAFTELGEGHVTYQPTDTAASIRTNTGGGGVMANLAVGSSVRRLTPLECSRLQGFPDDWLEIDPPLSDAAKYRMLGNAVAVPCAEWIARRLFSHMEERT